MGMRVSTIQQNIVNANLSENELRALNATVVGLLRAGSHMKAVKASMQFRIGQSVKFLGRGGRTYSGTITKINPKTIAVAATKVDGMNTVQKWIVASTLIQPAI